MLPVRKNIRLQGYDYAQGGYYSLTVCTFQKQHLFGEIVDEKMRLSNLGNLLAEMPEQLFQVDLQDIPAFVIMPNHIHAIIRLEPGRSLARVVQQFKARFTRLAQTKVWQRGYYEHIIRTEQDYNNELAYIGNNPQNWLLEKDRW